MSVTLTINGHPMTVERGQTVLQAAREHDIYIPTLCDWPGLPSQGSCRMCIVEIQGRTNTPTACTTPVEEGMVVETDTPRVRDLRGELLRMLLADHPGGCLFCPENQHCAECMVTLRKTGVTTGCHSCPADGQCELQEMVRRSGLSSVAYPVRYRALRVEKEDPFFDRDYNLCVLCGRCIRVCETLHFTHIPTYVKRGSETRVGTSFGLSHLAAGCSFCGACVEACPTGSLMEKTRKWDGRADAETVTTCPFCSLGCEIRLDTQDNGEGSLVIGSLPGETAQTLCVKGRFGITETVNHPRRLKRVLRAEHGAGTRLNWDEAARQAADALSGCPAQECALVVSASSSSEELYLARKFALEALGGAPVYLDAAARYGAGLGAVRRLLARSQPVAALDGADLIFCLGLDAQYAQSVVESRLSAAKARGAKLLTLNAEDHVPGRFADLWLRPRTGAERDLVEQLAGGEHISVEVDAAVELIRAARQPMFVIGPNYLARIPDAVERLVQAAGAALVALPAEANLAGALRQGLGVDRTDAPPRVLYLIGVPVPMDLDPEVYVLYQNTHAPRSNLWNGLGLPAAAFSEIDGSLIDQAGRVRPLRAAVSPPEDALPGWQILCRIAQAMGKSGFDYPSVSEIAAEIAAQPALEPPFFKPPAWLPVPGEHDYLGAPLADWAAGLRMLALFQREEETHVPAA